MLKYSGRTRLLPRTAVLELDRLPNYLSLKLNKDFLRLYHRGKSCARPALVVYAMKNRVGICRVGITTSKKIGNAVQRNRARRVIRAAFQAVQTDAVFSGGWDLVFVARTRTTRLKSTQVETTMREALAALGVTK